MGRSRFHMVLDRTVGETRDASDERVAVWERFDGVTVTIIVTEYPGQRLQVTDSGVRCAKTAGYRIDVSPDVEVDYENEYGSLREAKAGARRLMGSIDGQVAPV